MTVVLRLLRRIADQLGVESDGDDATRADSLTEPTNIHEIAQAIRQTPARKEGA